VPGFLLPKHQWFKVRNLSRVGYVEQKVDAVSSSDEDLVLTEGIVTQDVIWHTKVLIVKVLLVERRWAMIWILGGRLAFFAARLACSSVDVGPTQDNQERSPRLEIRQLATGLPEIGVRSAAGGQRMRL